MKYGPSMFDSLMNQVPLTLAAKALKVKILSIPRTNEPMMDDHPDDLPLETTERLHDLALSGSRHAVPEIRRVMSQFPRVPKLLNYLHVTHMVRKEIRQAEAVLKQLAEEHPDYLFARVALSTKALDKDQSEKAATYLGPTLDIQDLYPQRDLFHVSELRNYYLNVARILARRGDQSLALGVKSALMEIEPHEAIDTVIIHEVMMANLRDMQNRTAADEKRRITVRPRLLPDKSSTTQRPTFHHDLIDSLYEFDMDLPEDMIEEILALPREFLERDLIAVLEDCIARTPDFMCRRVRGEEDFAAFHALHLLAEIKGHVACGSLLHFLSMHPRAVDFWLGEVEAYVTQIAQIIPGDLPACFVWLKSPGIDSRAKGMVTEAMEQIAKSEPQRVAEITSGLGELLGFLIDSPPEDNILDTGFIFIVISVLTELRATNELPVIRKAYQKDLVELFKAGSLESIEDDMILPLRKPQEWISMVEQYDKSTSRPDEDDVKFTPPTENLYLDGLIRNPFAPAPAGVMNAPSPAPAGPVGRNDSCPCGSGRKFKKCCMK